MAIYLDAIKSLYLDNNKFQVLTKSNLLTEYLRCVRIVEQMEDIVNAYDIETIILKIPELEYIRYFIAKYLAHVLVLKYKQDQVEFYVEGIIYRIDEIFSEIRLLIRDLLSTDKKNKLAYTYLFEIISRVSRLLFMYKMILLQPIEEVIDFTEIELKSVSDIAREELEQSEAIAKSLEKRKEQILPKPKNEEKPIKRGEERFFEHEIFDPFVPDYDKFNKLMERMMKKQEEEEELFKPSKQNKKGSKKDEDEDDIFEE